MRLALLVASCLAEELCHEPLVLLQAPGLAPKSSVT